jgi:hypothetical protein
LKDLKKSEDGRYHKNRIDIICADVKTDGGISAQGPSLSPKSVTENMQGLTDAGDILLVFLWGSGVDLGAGDAAGGAAKAPATFVEIGANATAHSRHRVTRATAMRLTKKKPGGAYGVDLDASEVVKAREAAKSGDIPTPGNLEGSDPADYEFGDNPALGFPATDRIIRSNYGDDSAGKKSPFMPWMMFAEGIVEMWTMKDHKFKMAVILGDFFNSGSFFDWIRPGSPKQTKLATKLSMTAAELDEIPIFALATVPDDTTAMPPYEKHGGHPTQYKFMENYAEGGIMGGKTFRTVTESVKAAHFMDTLKYMQNAYATSFAMDPFDERPRDYKSLVTLLKKRNPSIMKKMGWNEPLMFASPAFPIDKDLADIFFEGTAAIIPPNSQHNAFFYSKSGGLQLKTADANHKTTPGSPESQLPGQNSIKAYVPEPPAPPAQPSCGGAAAGTAAFIECHEELKKQKESKPSRQTSTPDISSYLDLDLDLY